MGFISIFLISVGLAMDAFAVSIGKGLSVQKATIKQALCAGLWFGGFQALMPTIGYFVGQAFANFVSSIDHWIAFVLLVLIGANMIREAIKEGDDDDDSNASFGVKTMLVLAIATSIDALAAGVSFAFLEVNIWLAVATIGVVTFAFSAVGIKVGAVLGARFKKKAEIAGGIVLIAMGIKILVQHLLGL